MKPPSDKPASELLEEIWRLRPFFRRAMGFSVLASLLSLVSMYYMFEVYDRVVNSRNLTTLLMLTLLALGVYLVMVFLEWVRAEIMRHAGQQLNVRVGDRVFNAAFTMAIGAQRSTGQQAMNDLRSLRDFVSHPALLGMLELPVVLIFLAILFMIKPLLGWFAIVGAIVQLIIAVLNERRTQPPLAEANKAAIAAQTYAGGALRNAQVIESMGMLNGIHERWMRNQHEFLYRQAVASDQAGGFTAAAKSVQMIQTSALLGIGCWLLLLGQIPGGGHMLVGSMLGGKILQPLVRLITNWKVVINARDAFRRLDELLQQTAGQTESMSLPPPQGKLSVEAVTAGAPGSPQAILRNVAFILPAGECLAVVGPSASGKTTLARLLMGLWPTLSGKVRLDGVDVFHWDKDELGPHVGYLPQGVELFDGTLAENIARFGEVDREKVAMAARLTGIDSFVSELPEGFDSRIGEEGAFLSGGQRQRVGLARAVYGDPRFVVLDEPNASLDEAGEAALMDLLRHLKERGVTIVVITHRKSILAVADKMLLLSNGAVQAFGPSGEVMAALEKARAGGPPPRRPGLAAAGV